MGLDLFEFLKRPLSSCISLFQILGFLCQRSLQHADFFLGTAMAFSLSTQPTTSGNIKLHCFPLALWEIRVTAKPSTLKMTETSLVVLPSRHQNRPGLELRNHRLRIADFCCVRILLTRNVLCLLSEKREHASFLVLEHRLLAFHKMPLCSEYEQWAYNNICNELLDMNHCHFATAFTSYGVGLSHT